MSDPVIQPISSARKPLPDFQAFIRGRIAGVRKVRTRGAHGSMFITLVRLPAPKDDEFAYPPTIEILSNESLGKETEDWEGVVRISGFGRQVRPRPDPETGEVRDSYRTANVQLWLVP